MTPADYLRERKIIAIVREVEPAVLVRLGQALLEGGIRMMEMTFNQRIPESWKETAAGIESVEKVFGEDLLVGAGTVITPDQVRMTRNSGGHYIVSPAVQPDLIRLAKDLGMGAFPGAFTPTEILAAYTAGADAVKVFPAGIPGPEYIRAIRAPLNHIPLIAVGGVSLQNAADFRRAGCIALGIGGQLVNREWIANGEWDRITDLAKQIVSAFTAP